jgi:hypothetical protein
MRIATHGALKSIEDSFFITVSDPDSIIANDYLSDPAGRGKRQFDRLA